MNIVASVQARLGSTRLPGKVLFPFGSRRLIQWSISRTKDAKTINETIAAIGDQPENDAIKEYLKRSGISYIVGPENDLLSRHLNVIEHTGCDIFVRITADCPFVPSEEINRVVNEHLSNNARYTTNVMDKMPIGIGVDAIDPDLLVEFKDLGETHPVKRARANPERWGTAWSYDSSWAEVADAHLAIDTPSDYWSLVDALVAVGDDPYAIAEWLLE